MTEPLELRLRRDLARVADTTAIPAAPRIGSRQPARRHRHRLSRRVALVVIGLVVVGTGVPVAAATGAGSAITAAFGWANGGTATPTSPGHPALPGFRAEDRTARLVLRLRQDDENWQIWEARAVGGGQCISVLEPVGHGYRSLSLECSIRMPPSVSFGSGNCDAAGCLSMLSGAGSTYLTLAYGRTVHRLPVADGISAAWIPLSDCDQWMVLTGYSRTGRVVGRATTSGLCLD